MRRRCYPMMPASMGPRMSDVIVKNKPKTRRGSPKTRRGPPKSVEEKRVRRDGRVTTIRVVDAASPTFGEDMLYVFRKNVEAARRENKRVTGVADFVPGKQ